MPSIEELRDLLGRCRYSEALELVSRTLHSTDPKERLEWMAAALWDCAESSSSATSTDCESMYRAAIELERKAQGEFSEGVYTPGGLSPLFSTSRGIRKEPELHIVLWSRLLNSW